jgi:hypothetical protein
MTVLPQRGVIADFALLFPWSPPSILLLAGNQIAMIVAPVTHHISADRVVT